MKLFTLLFFFVHTTIAFGQTINKPSTKIPAEINKWLSSQLAKSRQSTLVDFNSPEFFRTDSARLIGYIKNYSKAMSFKTGMVYLEDVLTAESVPRVITIHPDGRFEVSLPLNHPVCNSAIINDCWLPFYLEPGQVLAMVLDMEILTDEKISEAKPDQYIGNLANINYQISGFKEPAFNYNEFERKTAT